MPFGDSAQSGIRMPGLIPLAGCDQGYSMGKRDQERLAQEFLFEHLGVDKSLFAIDGGYDCYYGNNYCHAELRAGGLFMRPSFASKLILKSSLDSGVFHNKSMHYAYHGTPPKNVKSILGVGFKPSKTGAAGPGLYMSPYPLYAQLYSSSSYAMPSPTEWTSKDGRKFFVDTLFMIRYPAAVVTERRDGDFAVKEIAATVGSGYNLHKLFSSASWSSAHRGFDFDTMVIGCLHPDVVPRVSLQGVIVKFHEKNPYEQGGEFDKLTKLLQ